MTSSSVVNPNLEALTLHIVVTGGAGFIGSHLCEALLAQGHSVTAIDNFLTGNPQNIAHLHDNPGFQLVEHDIVRPLDTEEINALPPVDSIFHLATPASPADFSRIPLADLLSSTRRAPTTCSNSPVKHRARYSDHLHLRSLRRPRSPSPDRNLLRQRQPGRPPRLLRRGQALRRGLSPRSTCASTGWTGALCASSTPTAPA